MRQATKRDTPRTTAARAVLGAFCGGFFGMCLPLWWIERRQHVTSFLSFGMPTDEAMIRGLTGWALFGAALGAVLAVVIGRSPRRPG